MKNSNFYVRTATGLSPFFQSIGMNGERLHELETKHIETFICNYGNCSIPNALVKSSLLLRPALCAGISMDAHSNHNFNSKESRARAVESMHMK